MSFLKNITAKYELIAKTGDEERQKESSSEPKSNSERDSPLQHLLIGASSAGRRTYMYARPHVPNGKTRRLSAGLNPAPTVLGALYGSLSKDR